MLQGINSSGLWNSSEAVNTIFLKGYSFVFDDCDGKARFTSEAKVFLTVNTKARHKVMKGKVRSDDGGQQHSVLVFCAVYCIK